MNDFEFFKPPKRLEKNTLKEFKQINKATQQNF